MIEKVHWHARDIAETVAHLRTHLEQGLTTEEAGARRQTYGPNELKERPGPTFLQLLLNQFKNFLVMLLIGAALISMVLSEFVDAAAIMAIVVVNAMIGVVQESRAEGALQALRKMAAPVAHVIRDGHSAMVPAPQLVPGDIVFLEAGNYVPADVRLIESVNLRIDEASLTGESVPVEKHAARVLSADAPVGDRTNTALMSTMVTYGRGKGIVVGTGMNTEIGLIAEMIQSYEEEETPLQRRLAQLGRFLGIACLTIVAIVFVVGFLRGEPLLEMFMTAVTLAIAAVPEGLPAVVTVCLALGMQRMLRRRALIRRLPAVETLGCTTVICSDKTGTLTQNEMTVVKVYSAGRLADVSGQGYGPTGHFSLNGSQVDGQEDHGLRTLLEAALGCSDAILEAVPNERGGDAAWRIVGDPTEGALVVAAAKAGLWKKDTDRRWPRCAEIPFDSERKRMTTIHRNAEGDSYVAFVKGAPDVMLELCDRYMDSQGAVLPMMPDKTADIAAANEAMASNALRVLAVAIKPMAELPREVTPETVETGLIFVGLLGMIDPPRPEVKEAVRVAQSAGIKSVMITGDHRDTAVAIARELDLLGEDGLVLTGTELDRMDDATFSQMVERVDVYARVSPQHKVKIVEALKARGHVVAMTGDGVNDAPALKRASIGVAMGITGTDVSKQTADMVLTDDNYASIVSAVEEGRTIYANIRKFVFYLVSANLAEILTVFTAIVAGLPIPLKPIQLLWLNLITDGAPALALGMEKAEPRIMERPPRPTNEPIFNREMQRNVVVWALSIFAATFAAFIIGLQRFEADSMGAQTMAFVTLSSIELVIAFSARSERYSPWAVGLFSNRAMLVAVASSFLLLIPTIYIPFLNPIFHTVPLSLEDWLVLLPLILFPAVVAEITKSVVRLVGRRQPMKA